MKKIMKILAVLVAVFGVSTIVAIETTNMINYSSYSKYGEVRQLSPLESGKYYAYGDTSRPYYEIAGNTIKLVGVPFEYFVESAAPDDIKVSSLTETEKYKIFLRYYEEYMSSRYYTPWHTNIFGDVISLGQEPYEAEFIVGDACFVVVPNTFLGFTKTSDRDDGLIPYYLVNNNSEPFEFVAEYKVPALENEGGFLVRKALSPEKAADFMFAVDEMSTFE